MLGSFNDLLVRISNRTRCIASAGTDCCQVALAIFWTFGARVAAGFEIRAPPFFFLLRLAEGDSLLCSAGTRRTTWVSEKSVDLRLLVGITLVLLNHFVFMFVGPTNGAGLVAPVFAQKSEKTFAVPFFWTFGARVAAFVEALFVIVRLILVDPRVGSFGTTI